MRYTVAMVTGFLEKIWCNDFMTFHLLLWSISHWYDKPNCIWKRICKTRELGKIKTISSLLNSVKTSAALEAKGRFTRYDFVAYDRPTTGSASCKSNLQLVYDCRVGAKSCHKPVVVRLFHDRTSRSPRFRLCLPKIRKNYASSAG